MITLANETGWGPNWRSLVCDCKFKSILHRHQALEKVPWFIDAWQCRRCLRKVATSADAS